MRPDAERVPRVGRARRLAAYALLALATVLAYEGIRHLGFQETDDPDYVTRNGRVQQGVTLAGLRWAATTFHAANWHPLTWASHMLDVELFGMSAFGHHATNVALHVANALLLLYALDRMTRRFWRSACVAALFALHPLHVESVAWVAERKDVLSTLFFMLVLVVYAHYVERPSLARLAAVSLLYAFGLTAKPMLVSAPFALLLLDVWPLSRWRTASCVREKLPLLALALGSCAITYLAQRSGGAVQSPEALPISTRAANALVAYAGYLSHSVWPSGLIAFYPLIRPIDSGLVAVSTAVVAALSGFAVAVRRRRPYVLVGWLWYLGTLVPVIGLVQVGSQAMADRYTYIPLIGVFLAAVWLAADSLAKARAPARARAALSIAAIAGCGAVTHHLVGFWKDPLTLYGRVATLAPLSSFGHQSLGNALIQAGRADEGLQHMQEALRLSPNFPFAHNGMGAALLGKGEIDEAIPHFRAAIAARPRYFDAYFNLGLALNLKNEHEGAIAAFAAAVEIDPFNSSAQSNLAQLCGATGKLVESLEHYRAALELRPDDVETRRWVAVTLTLLDRVEEAIAEYEAISRARPDDVDALNNIAWIRAVHAKPEHRNGAEAVEYAERARDACPAPVALVFDTLAAAYAEAGRFEDAVEACERAIALAAADGNQAAVERFTRQLELFRAGRPFHNEAP